jgi:hypothetical protein
LNEFDFRMNNRAKLGVPDDLRAARTQGCGRQAANLPTGRLTKDTAFMEGRAKLRLIVELLENTIVES